MQIEPQPSRSSGGHPTHPANEDAIWETAVLSALLEAYPEPYTETELAQAVLKGKTGFQPQDAFQRALRDLIAADLVYRNGKVIHPTRTAVRFEELVSS